MTIFETIGLKAVFEGGSQYISDLNKAGEAEQKLGNNAQKASKDVDTIGKSAQGSQGHVSKLAGAMGDMAKIAGGFVIGQGLLKLPSLFGDMIGNASDMAESLSKVKVVFGDAAPAVEAFANKAATSMGMSKQAALEATGTFGNFLQAMGQTPSAAKDMSLSMVQLAADLASFNNADPTEVLLALRSGLSGEAEPMRRFGVALSESAVQAKAAELGIASLGSELTEQQKITARYAIIMDQTKTAQGDFARTSEGHANQMRILKAQLTDVSAEMGNALLPVIVTLGQGFVTLLQAVAPFVAKASELVALGLDTVFGLIGQGLEAISGPASTLAGMAWDGLTALADWAGKMAGIAWDKISGPLGEIAGMTFDGLSKLAGWVADIAGVAWDKIEEPLGKIAGYAATLAGLVWDQLKKLPGIFVDLAGVAWEKIEGPLGKIADFATTVGGAIGTAALEFIKSAKDELSDQKGVDDSSSSWDKLGKGIQRAGEFLKPFVDDLLTTLGDKLDEAGEAMGELGDAFGEFMKSLEPLMPVLGVLVTVLLAALIKALEIIVTIIADSLIGLVEALTVGFLALAKAIDIGVLLFETGKKVVEYTIDAKSRFEDLGNGIKKAVGEAGDKISDFGKSMAGWLEPALGPIQWVVDRFWDVVHAIDGVIERIQWLINKLKQIPSPGDIAGGILNKLPGGSAIGDAFNTVTSLGGILNARGTQDWKGGWSIVGEEGPELAWIPQHASIYPANVSRQMMSMGIPGFAAGLNYTPAHPNSYQGLVGPNGKMNWYDPMSGYIVPEDPTTHGPGDPAAGEQWPHDIPNRQPGTTPNVMWNSKTHAPGPLTGWYWTDDWAPIPKGTVFPGVGASGVVNPAGESPISTAVTPAPGTSPGIADSLGQLQVTNGVTANTWSQGLNAQLTGMIELLQNNLTKGISMTADEIKGIFNNLYDIVHSSDLAQEAKDVFDTTLASLATGLASGAGVANQDIISLIKGVADVMSGGPGVKTPSQAKPGAPVNAGAKWVYDEKTKTWSLVTTVDGVVQPNANFDTQAPEPPDQMGYTPGARWNPTTNKWDEDSSNDTSNDPWYYTNQGQFLKKRYPDSMSDVASALGQAGWSQNDITAYLNDPSNVAAIAANAARGAMMAPAAQYQPMDDDAIERMSSAANRRFNQMNATRVKHGSSLIGRTLVAPPSSPISPTVFGPPILDMLSGSQSSLSAYTPYPAQSTTQTQEKAPIVIDLSNSSFMGTPEENANHIQEQVGIALDIAMGRDAYIHGVRGAG